MRTWIKIAMFSSIVGALGLTIYSRIPSICTNAEFAHRSARGAVMALLPSPGLAKFHVNPTVQGLGTQAVQVSGTLDTKEPAAGGKRKSYDVKLSCASGQYLQVIDAKLHDHDPAVPAPEDG